MDHKATFARTGRNEWGATYTVSAWDAEMGIMREVVSDVGRDTARRLCAEHNSRGAGVSSESIHLRLTLAQRERLADDACNAGKTLSEYVRLKCGL